MFFEGECQVQPAVDRFMEEEAKKERANDQGLAGSLARYGAL